MNKRKSNSIELKKDPVKSAAAVKLRYVTDQQEGITRKRSGNNFIFYYKNAKLKDLEQLQRIKSLVIPPAWENVWICALSNGHLQATGIDVKGRKQYRYHKDWNQFRNDNKFQSMYEFGLALPHIRENLKRDLSISELSKTKVLATITSLLETTHIRIGNSSYEKLYGSYGLSTMKDQHVKIKGGEIEFDFKGKKGVIHHISIKNKKLAKIVQKCRDIPGKELFQYYDNQGQRHSIDSGEVNDYIKEISGKEFTSKDFRTWSGTLACLVALKNQEPCNCASDIKKNIVAAIDSVAEQLGNTRAVCRSHYIHPCIISLYEEDKLNSSSTKNTKLFKDLDDNERLLMNILNSN